MSENNSYKATYELLGPYKVDVPSAWAYREGSAFETHAQVIIQGELYHVIVRVPKLRRAQQRAGNGE